MRRFLEAFAKVITGLVANAMRVAPQGNAPGPQLARQSENEGPTSSVPVNIVVLPCLRQCSYTQGTPK